jgi:DivIVA domain-containing protein
MDVSAQTLREVAFREKLRGYHPDDVDEFLERVAAGIDHLQDRLRQATERAQRAETRAAESTEGDDALKRTLVLAQRTAQMAVQEAKQEADRIASSARAEANAIVAQAEDMARRTIEETQGGIRGELNQLETARDRLRSDISALERHLDDERLRLRASLSEALHAVEEHLAPPPQPAPARDEVAIPPRREPKVGPLPELTPDVIADFASPEPTADLGEPEAFEIEIVPTVGEGSVAPTPAPTPAPMAEPAPAPAAPAASDGPLFDELAEPLSLPDVFAPPADEPAAAPEPQPEPEPVVAAAPPAPVDDPADDSRIQAVEEDGDAEDEDPFIAELRRAITDTQPLGPREEGDVTEGTHEDRLMHGDVLDSSRLGSLLRRRR